MSKDTTTRQQRPFKTTRLEVVKTVVIAVLITGIATFIVGVRFEQSRQTQMDTNAAQAVQDAATVKK